MMPNFKTYNPTALFRISAILCLCVLFINKSFAQSADIKVSVDSTKITIGDQFHLQINATYNPQSTRVQFPSIPDTFQHFEVVERSKLDTVISRNQSTFKQTITLTSFDSGAWHIPPMAFQVQPLQGDTPHIHYTDSFTVMVNTVAVDTAQPFKPIFGIKGAKMPLSQILMYVGIGVLLAVLIGLLIWYYIRRRRNRPTEVPKPVEISLPPHEKAMNALSKLHEENLWQQAREKEYHTQLTDIVRLYLEEQFGIDCFDKTSAEIMQQVKKLKALSTSRQSLRFIFDTADMVKFARSKPLPEEHLQSMEYAKEMIHESFKKFQSQQVSNNTQA